MKLNTIFFALAVLNTINFNCYSSIYEELAKENLKTLTLNENYNKDKEDYESKEYYQIYQEEYQRQCNLPIFAARQTIYKLLINRDKKKLNFNETVIDKETWQDLELIYGYGKEDIYLGSLIDKTNLEIGRVLLFKKIVNPLSDCHKLKKRQNLVKELVDNETIFNKCNNVLKNLKTSENIFLSLWQENNIFNNQLSFFTIKLPLADKYSSLKLLALCLNKNKYFLEVNDKLNLSFNCIYNFQNIAAAILLPIYAIVNLNSDNIKDKKGINAAQKLDSFIQSDYIHGRLDNYSTSGLISNFLFARKNKYAVSIASMITGLIFAKRAWISRNLIKDHIEFKKILHHKLTHCSKLLTAYKEITKLLVKNKTFSQNCRYLKNYSKTITFTKSKNQLINSELNTLINYLEDATFSTKPSNFSNAGIVFASYKLLLKYKDYFFDIYKTLGEIDSIVSIATLYKQYQNKETKFCFAEFIENNFSEPTSEMLNKIDPTTSLIPPMPDIHSGLNEGSEQYRSPFCLDHGPIMKINKFWNPFINNNKVITNSINFGETESRNILITGPNAGGKSTIGAKGITLVALLAQTLTIAPAESFSFTPFKKIITYLKINDDTHGGKSFFKKGVIRASKIKKEIEKLNENQYVLTAIDELFNGTNSNEGEAAAYCFLEDLAKHKNVICISTTHFPILTLLEKNTGLFQNYKVSVEENTKNIKYLYTLQKGIAKQNIALQILEEEGYNESFITNAKDIIYKRTQI